MTAPVSYAQELHAERAQRLARLSRRSPDALPPRPPKPSTRLVFFKDGQRVPDRAAPVPLPVYPPLPAPPRMPPLRPGHRVTARHVIFAVATVHGLSARSLMDRTTRMPSISRPRQIAFYLATEMTGLSLPQIGKVMGGFDHTTVIHARDAVARRIANEPDVAARVAAARAELERAAGAGENNGTP